DSSTAGDTTRALAGRPCQPSAEEARLAGATDPHCSWRRLHVSCPAGTGRRKERMKIRIDSIFTKIVFWFIVTVALSFVGFVVISIFFSARISRRDRIISGMHAFYLDEARSAYEHGGQESLAEYLRRLNSYTHTSYYLVDDNAI